MQFCAIRSPTSWSADSSSLQHDEFSPSPEVIRLNMGDLVDRSLTDLGDVVSRITEVLTSDRQVCLSDGSTCALLNSAVNGANRDEELTAGTIEACDLLLRDASSAGDFLVEVSPVIRRLMRNCWPGPVRLVFPNQLDDQLISHLSPVARRRIETGSGISLCVPGDPLLQRVLRQLPFPLTRLRVEKSRSGSHSALTIVNSDSQSIDSESEIHIDGHQWEFVTPSGLTSEDVARMTTFHSLFVCTGNTCRSPMAEATFRRLLAERLQCSESDLPQQGYEISSAGLAAGVGAPASHESVEVCRVHGVDLTGHSSQHLTEELLLSADKIFTMTNGHRESILSRYPELEQQVELLSRSGQDVSDPIGWGMEAYQQCHTEISESLQTLVEELMSHH